MEREPNLFPILAARPDLTKKLNFTLWKKSVLFQFAVWGSGQNFLPVFSNPLLHKAKSVRNQGQIITRRCEVFCANPELDWLSGIVQSIDDRT